MVEERFQRKLAAILAADVVGYSRLMSQDEEGTLAAFNAHRDELIVPSIAEHSGRIFKHTGDGFLAEFSSVVDAVRCATEIQDSMKQRNVGEPEDQVIAFRIGVNVGDVVVQDDDVYGDGVNIAARLEALAPLGGILLSDDAYRQVRGRVKVNFEELGLKELKNIAEPVRVYRVVVNGPDIKTAPPFPTLKKKPDLPNKPSVAVMPFVNMSGDDEQEDFADGLTEDLITTLSKLSGVFVIARNASFAYKGETRDLRQIAANLGVRYILDGSVRSAAKRIRVSIQLIDAENASPIWAERYDRVIEDVFAIQDEITLSVATELQVQLSEGEQARLRYTTTSNVEAWKHWVQGLAYYRRDVSKEGVGRAKEFWEKAVALDPHSAALNAMLGLIHWASARLGWWNDRETELRQSEQYVEAAISIDDTNADAHCVRALLLQMRGSHDKAVKAAWRAIDLGPGSADIAIFTSLIFNFSGQAEEALVQITKAMRLSPTYPAWYLGDLGFSYRLLGRHEDAIRVFREYGERSPGFGHIDLAIIYGELSRKEDAAAEAAQLLASRPGFTITSWRESQLYSDPARLEADVTALRETGLPE